ncbi:bifunctional DNA primase/polymerase [Streptomyces sp. 3214.6]|uniref:bifunctional DNA primase/polymerase n=1 Tax=Streptomyces sp. 3214.6 TaxID=1882757 RepID=UPI00090BC981|nr:bifunctional DNA primase/polymerase [Streptomyces sp. 3214.6]SHH95843.1 Bifunctional DNA primase/polymerase, N-terminal [Streptomyces sp. 3214.6]
MTHPADIGRDRDSTRPLLETALALAADGLPVLPLGRDKRPFANCPTCQDGACGGRPNMKTPGPCTCPRPCHAWAAATTDPRTIVSMWWRGAWAGAGAVGYHPGGAHLTVVDLDNAAAVAWAREHLPATLTVPSTRGEHWIYRGAMQSANKVRPGTDIKSRMSYARWLGNGTGHMARMPDAVRALVGKEETTPPRTGAGVDSSSPGRARWDRSVATGCRHTDAYVRTGLNRGVAKVFACREQGAGSQAYGVARFLASQHTACPGPCGLDALAQQIIDTAVSMGVPQAYAERAVTNGFAHAGLERAS